MVIHSRGGVTTRRAISPAAFEALCGVIQAAPSSVPGILSEERTYGPFYRPKEHISRGWPLYSLVAVLSRPGRRPNAPHRQCRGSPYTFHAHTSCVRLGVRHLQRRAHARPISPPSRAHLKGLALEPCGGTFTAGEASQRAPPSMSRLSIHLACIFSLCEARGPAFAA